MTLSETSELVGKSWALRYRRKGRPAPGGTTNVVIIEYAPSARLGNLKRGRRVIVAGRRVKMDGPARNRPVVVAAWRTERARYTMVADGSTTTTIDRVISCLP